jgi:hypothetical protein
MTRLSVASTADIDAAKLRACWPSTKPTDHSDVVERVGLHGDSWTLSVGETLVACDAIAEPVEDPDEPYGGVWCGVGVGRIHVGRLNDPRLDLCASTDGTPTAFAWVEPSAGAAWVVVRDGDYAEVYAVASDLPVRVTTTENVEAEGSAAFDVEEYASDGGRIRAYVLDAAVAG